MDPRMEVFVSNEAQNNVALAEAGRVVNTAVASGREVSGIFGVPTGQAPIQGSGPNGFLTVSELLQQGYNPAEDRIYLTIGKVGVGPIGTTEDAGPAWKLLTDTSVETQPSTRLEAFLSRWDANPNTPQVDPAAAAYRAIASKPAVQAAIAQAFNIPG